MRHPFWALNSALFVLAFFALILTYFSQVRVPEREDVLPDLDTIVVPEREKSLEINVQRIYENDLFDTFKMAPLPTERPSMAQLPELPRDQVITIPKQLEAHFVDPLDVTLKGIIVLQDTTGNRAIIGDNKTGKETVYTVGNTFDDAQLVAIFSNKVVFVRSNGQQEVLYLREQDAKLDPSYLAVDGWDSVIKPRGNNLFSLDPSEFTKRVQNLAQIIDMLSLTSVYKKGVSTGCRIGVITEKSLGGLLGLRAGDVIISINTIPATTTEQRFNIYKALTHLTHDDKVTIQLARNSVPFTIEIALQDFNGPEKTKEQKKQLLEKKYVRQHPSGTKKESALARQKATSLDVAVEAMRKQELSNMLHKGSLS